MKQSQSHYWGVWAFILGVLLTAIAGGIFGATSSDFINPITAFIGVGLVSAISIGWLPGIILAGITSQIVWRRELAKQREEDLRNRIDRMEDHIALLHEHVVNLTRHQNRE